MWSVLVSVALAADNTPAYPVWPDQWNADFVEVNKLPDNWSYHNTTGHFNYDWTNKVYSISRANGRYDRYCGLNGSKAFEDTPCTQYVDTAGDRYIYYPDKNECCFCCDAAHGCGILKPTWMTGAEFLGEQVYNGVNAYKWNQKGLQNNFYMETAAEDPLDRELLYIIQEPDAQDYYSNFEKTVSAAAVQLPSICSKETSCSFFSTCHAVGVFGAF